MMILENKMTDLRAKNMCVLCYSTIDTNMYETHGNFCYRCIQACNKLSNIHPGEKYSTMNQDQLDRFDERMSYYKKETLRFHNSIMI